MVKDGFWVRREDEEGNIAFINIEFQGDKSNLFSWRRNIYQLFIQKIPF